MLSRICSFIILITSVIALSAINHSGQLPASEEWTPAGNPHYINGDLSVPNGVTLTIAAGCNVYVYDDVDVNVYGVLNCLGTSSQNVLITSRHHNLNPAPGDWGCLMLNAPDGVCTFSYTSILYGGGNSDGRMIRLVSTGQYAHFSHCVIGNSADSGLHCESPGEMPTIENCSFTGNLGYPVKTGARNIDELMASNTFSGNGEQAIYVYGDGDVNGTWPGWNGHYHIYGDLDSPNGSVWDIGAGATLKFAQGTRASVNGGFSAQGTFSDPITFTCLADPGYPGAWRGFSFSTLEGVCPMAHCDFSYAGGGGAYGSLWFSGVGGDVSLDHCSISDGAVAGVYSAEQGLVVAISNTNITDNAGYAVQCGAAMVGAFGSGNNFTGNTSDNILISGGYTGNATWSVIPGVDYEIDGWPRVDDGCVLTLEPGVELLFHDSEGFEVLGAIRALGIPGYPVTFTSVQGSPGPGQWRSLYLNGADSCRFERCNFNYGGGGSGGYFSDHGLVCINNSGPVYFDNCSLRYSGYHGVRATSNNNINFTDCVISNNNNNGLNIESDGSNPHFDGCHFDSNGGYPVVIMADNIGDITNCTFGSNGVDRIRVNGGTTGDCVMHDLPMPYEIGGTLTVADNTTLTIEPGVELLFDNSQGLTCVGAIQALGTQAEPITFTSSAASPSPGAWTRIYLNQVGEACQFDWCVFDYGGADVFGSYSDERAPVCIYSSPNVAFNNCTFTRSAFCGVRMHNNASPTFTNCTFSNNGDTAISVEATAAFPTVTDCDITDNGGYPVVIGCEAVGGLHSFTATGNATQRVLVSGGNVYTTTWLNHGLPYEITGHINVQNDNMFTLSPGVELLFRSGVGMTAVGGITAPGTETDPIVFTSSADTPSPGAWTRLYLNQVDETCQFDWCVFDYGGADIYGSYADERAPVCIYYSQNVTFNHCAFTHSANFGVRLHGYTSPAFNNCTFGDNGDNAIHVEAATSFPTVDDCVITDNNGYPVSIGCEAVAGLHSLTATGNATQRIHVNGGNVFTVAWLDHGIPYEIGGYVNVQNNHVLTLSPGVELLFAATAGMDVVGGVMALGTEAEHIVFTGAADSLYPGCWYDLYVHGSDTANQFAWCDFSYGGIDRYGTPYDERCLVALYDVDDIAFQNCSFSHSANHGVRTHSYMAPVFTDCVWNDNGDMGLSCESASAAPQIAGGEFTGNGGKPLSIHVQNLGGVASMSASGNGDEVIEITGASVGNLTMHNFGLPYRLTGSDINVNSGATLAIEPGVELRMASQRGIQAFGAIQAIGAQEEPIVFTGDTQTPGFWRCVYLNNTSAPSDFAWCDFTYGGADVFGSYTNELAPVAVYQCSPTFTDCSFSHNGWGLRTAAGSAPQLVRCSLTDNPSGGVLVDGGTPVFGGSLSEWNDLNGNGGYALRNNTSAALNAGYVWWGDASADSIAAWIWDGDDQTGLGVVDFEPWTDATHTIEYGFSIPAPQNLRIVINAGQVELSWDAAPGATLYRVYSANDPDDETWTLEADNLTSTTWSQPAPDTKRYYRVTADN